MMFTDLVRSTRLIDAIGDEDWNHLVRWHDKTFQGLIRVDGQKITLSGTPRLRPLSETRKSRSQLDARR
jgi:hypothetical protein